MVGACLRLPKDLRRTLAQYDNDDPLWVLVGPGRDDNWNFWMVAYNEEHPVIDGWFVGSCGGGDTTPPPHDLTGTTNPYIGLHMQMMCELIVCRHVDV